MDQHDLAAPDGRLRDHRIVGGDEGLRDPSRGHEVDTRGNEHAVRRGNREHLGLPATAHEAEDPVADGKRVDVRPEPDDLAGELEPGNVGRPTRRGGVETGALGEVGAVQPGTVHTDEHLAVARFGIGSGLDHELLVPRHESCAA